MKNIVITLAIGLTVNTLVCAQTGIGTQMVSNESSVLEFALNDTKGIILPAVESLPPAPSNGTLLFDRNDKKIKVLQDNTWTNLSERGSDAYMVPYSGSVDNEKSSIIGAKTTTASGVLVLESKTKALLLPKIDRPHLTVKSPYPGMICYDIDRKALAVYDGVVWNYWN